MRQRRQRPQTRLACYRVSLRLDFRNATVLSPPGYPDTRAPITQHSRAGMPSQPVERQRSTLMTFVAGLAWCGFKLGFGLTSLASVWASAALKDGTLWANDTKEEKQELAAAQEKYWSLDRQPLPGFRHAFFTTGAGTRLHFVTNANAGSSDAKNVCLFIHGRASPEALRTPYLHPTPTDFSSQASPTPSSSGATSSSPQNSSATTSSSQSTCPATVAPMACQAMAPTTCSKP